MGADREGSGGRAGLPPRTWGSPGCLRWLFQQRCSGTRSLSFLKSCLLLYNCVQLAPPERFPGPLGELLCAAQGLRTSSTDCSIPLLRDCLHHSPSPFKGEAPRNPARPSHNGSPAFGPSSEIPPNQQGDNGAGQGVGRGPSLSSRPAGNPGPDGGLCGRGPAVPVAPQPALLQAPDLPQPVALGTPSLHEQPRREGAHGEKARPALAGRLHRRPAESAPPGNRR